jgi:DNA-binding SARP family transcriptional activator
MILVCRAHFALETGDENAANEALRSAMAIGREEGYTNFYWWRSDVISRLCAKALDSGIEVEYATDLVRKRGLLPASPPYEVENWPWRFDVRTLGGFEMYVNGAPLGFTVRVQRKPLELLKAIIAFGGNSVAAHQLIDALWPDSEGDVGRKSFDTTLHRLRKLVGDERAILIEDGRITLAPNLWRLDIWTFEHLFSRIERRIRGENVKKPAMKSKGDGCEEIAILVRKVLKTYRGHFLPADSDPRSITARDRLSTMFVRLIILVGSDCERYGKWEEAREYYQAGLEIDNTIEDFYQRLILSCARLERFAEAVATYNRCRTVMKRVFGVAPSSRTEEIYASLKIGH